MTIALGLHYVEIACTLLTNANTEESLRMDKQKAKECLGALQMLEVLLTDGNDKVSIDAFCFLWNTIANYAEEEAMV
jgi:hypothetical protein